MESESHWDYGWYGSEFIVTKEDHDGTMMQQMAIPESVAIAMIPVLETCLESRKED